MKVVVGLGNPGRKYQRTPHNVGFAAVDALAERLDCAVRGSFRFKARIGRGTLGDEDLMLVKPETYMNRSGVAVAPILRRNGLSPSELIVVLDDADMDLGRLRIRRRGSDGGHKGLASIVEHIGSEEFARIRIGIGRSSSGDLVEHVLTPFAQDEMRAVGKAVLAAVDAVICIVQSGIEAAMNEFNGKNAVGV